MDTGRKREREGRGGEGEDGIQDSLDFTLMDELPSRPLEKSTIESKRGEEEEEKKKKEREEKGRGKSGGGFTSNLF